MAKKTFSLDDLELDEAPPVSQRRKRPSNLNQQGVSTTQARQAQGFKLVKGRTRKTIFLPPDLIEGIDAAARQEGAKLMDFYHWLLALAYESYVAGDITPEYTEDVRVVRGLDIPGYEGE